MLTISDLEGLGFLRSHARLLLQDNAFVLRVKNWDKPVFERHLKQMETVYGVSREQATKAIFSAPQFAGYNHDRVLKGVMRIYGVSRKQATKAIFSVPRFAGYNHDRVLKGVMRIYGVSRKQATKAIFSFVVFAGLNHDRVLRQAVQIGKTIGLNREEIVKLIIANPVMAGYSRRRNLAMIDAFRNAAKRANVNLTKQQAVKLYTQLRGRSPYPVEGSKKRETIWTRKTGQEHISRVGQLIQKRLQNKRK